MILRPPEPGDFAAVARLLAGAFGRIDEADLVDALRRDGDMAVEGVALIAGEVVGYAAFSQMASPVRTLGLGPVATTIGHRRRGVASALIRWGLGEAERQRICGVFVLGEPAFYGRFDFDAARAAAFLSPYAGPHFMALALDDAFPAAGSAKYAAAFRRFEG